MFGTRNMRRSARPQLETLDARVLPASGLTIAAHMAVVEARIEARHEILEAKLEAREAVQAAKLAAREATLAAKEIRLTTHSNATITPVAPITATPTPSPVSTAPTTPVTTTPATTVATTSAVASTPTAASPITSAVTGSSAPAFIPTSTDVGDVQNGPLAKAGQNLIEVYQQYESFISGGGSAANFKSTVGTVEVSGGNVGVDLSASGDLASYEAAVQALGMNVQHVDTATGTVEGLLPIDQLVAVAQLSTTASINPILAPVLSSGGIR